MIDVTKSGETGHATHDQGRDKATGTLARTMLIDTIGSIHICGLCDLYSIFMTCFYHMTLTIPPATPQSSY